MKEKEINYPTNIQVFENGLILGDLCLTQMNCILKSSSRRIELDFKYHYKDEDYIWTNNCLYILDEESEDTFEVILPLFYDIVKEAEDICITKAIVLKGMDMDVDIALSTIKETFELGFHRTIAHLEKINNAEDKFEKIDSASTVLDVINEENKVEFEDFSIIHLECLFDVLDNCLLVNYRYKYTGEDSDDFTYSNTIRLLKDNNVEDIIDYYPIFKLAVFAGLNNAKHEYQDAQQYYCEKDAIKEELNKSFLITYAHIQVFKELNK